MRHGSLRIATIAGIGVFVHWTFGLLLAWVLFATLGRGGTPVEALLLVTLVVSIFICVVLHEYGHALTARRFGVRTLDIVLLPIGGIARLERMPTKPVEELLVALAGPAVNVVIAAVLTLVFVATPVAFPGVGAIGTPGGLGWFLGALLQVNVLLVVFNMIPAFPMDGGRVLRAMLSMGMDRTVATRIAARVGQVIAVLFAVVGIVPPVDVILLLIAAFIFFSARAEAAGVEVEAVLRGCTVRDAMLTRFWTLDTDDTMDDAGEKQLISSQQDFPVSHDGHYVGMLLRTRLQGTRGFDPRETLASVVDTSTPVLHEEDELTGAMVRLGDARTPAAAVVRDDHVIGLLTIENVQELARLRAARMAIGAAGR